MLEWQQYYKDEKDEVRSEWLSAPMVPDAERGAGWYKQSQAITAPPVGNQFRYSAVVTDADGNETDTETFSVAFHPVPDWSVAIDPQTGDPMIRYGYDSERGWGVQLRIENKKEAPAEAPGEGRSVSWESGSGRGQGAGRERQNDRRSGCEAVGLDAPQPASGQPRRRESAPRPGHAPEPELEGGGVCPVSAGERRLLDRRMD